MSNPTRAAMRAVSASYTPGIRTVSAAIRSRIRCAPVIGGQTNPPAARPAEAVTRIPGL
jgi:hypothetical protein